MAAAGTRRPPPLSPTAGAYGPDYGQDMTERMLTLESRLGSLERARRVKKARTLLKCADWVIRSATASMVLSGAFVGHYLALLVQLRGWDVTCMEVLQPGLGEVVGWLEPVPSSWAWSWARAPVSFLRQLQAQHPTSIDSYWFVMAVAMLTTVLLVSSTVYRRSTTAFSVAAVLVVAIELTKVRVRKHLASEAEAIWEEANYIYGAYLRLAFFRLKGSYIKMAQYISSRADIVPDAFSDELSALQDAVPPSPLAAVRPVIERALGAKLQDAFFRFETEALASASIAQVHRATLKDGTEVVVKVQHPDVARLLGIDLRNIVVILTAIGKLEPDYDFSMIAHEWSKEVRKELDFCLEGENLRQAYEGIVGKSGLDAVVPKVVHAAPDVLVMTYCEGVKVTDPRAFPDPATATEDKVSFMTTLCEVFAYGCYVEGFFQGDPHAGNIFVETVVDAEGRRHIRPVVLDWGLAKHLTEKVRVGNAKIVLSVWELDVAGMLDGMEECGMPVDKINVVEDLGNIRFMMRNTAPGTEAREQSKQFMEDFVEKNKKKPKSERNPLKTMIPEVLFLARVTEMLQGLGAKLGVRVEYMHIMAAGCKRALLERPRPALPPSTSSSSLDDPNPALSFLDRKVRALLQDLLAEGHGVGSQVVLYKNGRMLVNAAVGLRSRLDSGRVMPNTLFCGFSLTKAVLAILAHALVDDKVLGYETRLVDVYPELKGTGKDAVTLRHILTHSAGLQYAFPTQGTPQSMWDPATGLDAVRDAVPVGGAPGSRVAMHYYSFGWLLVPMLEQAAGKTLAELVHEKLLEPLGLRPQDENGSGGIVLGPVPGTADLAASDDPRLATVEYDLRQLMNEMTGGGEGGGGLMDGNMGGGLLEMMEGMMDFSGDGAAAEEAAFKDLVKSKLAGREFLLDHRMLNGKRCRATGSLPSLSGRFSARALADVLESLCRLERSSGAFAQQQFVTTTTSATPALDSSSSSPPTSMSTSSSSSETTSTVFANGHAAAGPVGLAKSSSSLAATPTGISPAATPFSLLSLARLQEMKASPVDDEPGLTRLMGRENTIKLANGVQLFGFEMTTSSSAAAAEGGSGGGGGGGATTRTVRWGSAYGHAGACGQLALCDPSTGVVLVVTSNKAAIPGQKNLGYEVLSLVAEELNLGKPVPFW